MPTISLLHKTQLSAAFVSVVLIWSTTPLAIKWSVQDLSISFALFLRMLIGVVLCGGLLKICKQSLPLHRKAMQTYFAGGVSLFVSMILTYWAAQHISSGLISVLYGLSPLMTSLAAAYWLKERSLTRNKIVGMLLGLLGLVLVFRSSLHFGATAVLGVALLLLAVLSQALGLVAMKRIGDVSSVLAVDFGVLSVAVPLFFLVWLLADGQLPVLAWNRSLFALLYLSVFGSVIGFMLYFYLIRYLATASVALITLITPVLALWLGQAMNDETIHLTTGLGALAIALGLILHYLDHDRTA